jgi:hypothetical protein
LNKYLRVLLILPFLYLLKMCWKQSKISGSYLIAEVISICINGIDQTAVIVEELTH